MQCLSQGKRTGSSLDNYAGEIAEMEADALKKQGKLDEADKRLQKARERFEEALKHDPNYVKAKENLARLGLGIPMTL
ncbi:MAG: hypothetical protein JRJ14_11055 [Deltaproteobacteria bacterium]|nr:hypothetical protein [Deltaproteobacteria bacterium]